MQKVNTKTERTWVKVPLPGIRKLVERHAMLFNFILEIIRPGSSS